MSLTRIRGNQISTATSGVIDALSFLDGESVFRLPAGTEAQRPGSPAVGTMRYNSEANNGNGQAEIYVADIGTGSPGWTQVGGGGASLGRGGVIRSNADYIDEDIDIDPSLDDKFKNAFTRGPLEIRDGYTVTVSNGADWEIWGGEPEDPPVGAIIAMGYAQTPATRYTINCQNLSDTGSTIPNMAVTYIPTRSTSRIIITATVSHNQHHVYSFGVKRNGTLLTAGVSGNTNTSSGSVHTGYKGHDEENYHGSDTFSYEDTTFTVGVAQTYEIAATASWNGTIRDLFINDRSSNDMRSISSMTVMEVMGE